MICTRFGDHIELVRVATLADVKTYERRKPDKEDRNRTRDGWRAIARYTGTTVRGTSPGEELHGKEILVDAAYLRADDGWKEISDAFHKLQGSVTP
jgi:hypothetical protein